MSILSIALSGFVSVDAADGFTTPRLRSVGTTGDFYINGLPFIFEQTGLSYKVQTSSVAVEFFDYYTVVYDKNFIKIAVYNDTWEVQYLNKQSKWVSTTFYNVVRSYEIKDDTLIVYRTGDTIIGKRVEVYTFSPGNPCKIEIRQTCTAAQSIKYIWNLNGIVADNSNVILSDTSQQEGTDFTKNDGSYALKVDWSQELEKTTVTSIVEPYAVGKKATTTFGAFTVLAGATQILDPTYRSAGVSPGANSTSCVVVKPVGLTVGDLMIAHIYFREHGSNDGQIGSPANWTLIRQDSYDGAACTSALFWKIADAGDVAATNFTFTGETGSNIGAISAWETGTFDADTPINANNGQGNGWGFTVTAPTITPSVANCMILMLVGASNDATSTNYAIATSDPGGWAEAYDIKTTEGSDSAVALGYVERPETSATGNGTASTSPTYSYSVGQLVAIAPEAGVSVPTLDTNAATSVEETTATLDGDIDDNGGENADYRGFVWDTSTHGDPGDTAPAASDYANYWTENGDYGVGNFTHGITSLTQGELYYYRACAHNSEGWAYGDEVTFLTKPEAPTGFTAVSGGDGDSIDLAWTNGTGSDKTYIRGKEDAYPVDRADGDLIYNDTGVSYSDTGLDEDDDWYYRAWAWCTEGGLEQYSDAYAQGWATATAWAEPTVTTNIFLGFGGTWAVLSGTIDDEGDAVVTEIGFDYGTTTGYGSEYTLEGTWHTGDSFIAVISNLSWATVYHYRAKADNTEVGYGSDMLVSTEGSATIYEYLNTGGDADSAHIYANNWGAQYFTVGATSHTVTYVRVYIKRTGEPGTVTISIKHATGAGEPTGADIVSTTLDGDLLSTDYAWYVITFDEVSLEADTEYAIVIRAVAGDTDNDIQWREDDGGGLADAGAYTSADGGISWSIDGGGADYLFEVWGYPCIDLVKAAVFEGYLEADDMLFLIHYKNVYPPYYPDSDPNSYFYLQLLDTDGLTVLAQTPCAQWGYMPGSIYLSADSAASLTAGSDYYLAIYGNFGDNPSDLYQLTSADWLGTVKTYLDNWVRLTAQSMETYYTEVTGGIVTLTVSIAGQGVALNQSGHVLFVNGIPELSTVRPNLFEYAVIYPEGGGDTPSDEFSGATTWETMVGDDAANLANNIGEYIAIDGKTVIALLLMVAMLAVSMFVLAKGHATVGLALAFPFIIAAGILRVLDIAIIAIVGMIALMLFVWSFWWSRT